MNRTTKANAFKLLLALVTVAAFILSGCSKSTPEEGASPSPTTAPSESSEPGEAELPQVQLTWHYGIGALQPDQQEVEDAVNKYLKENTKLNATIKLVPIDFGSYDQKLNPMIAANESMDLMWTTQSWLGSYPNNVSNGAFLALDDLLPQYAPKTFNEMMPVKFWEDIKYPADHKIYAIPNYQIAATASGFVFRKDLVEKYGFDTTSVKQLSDLEPFLKTLKENEPDIIPLAFQNPPNFQNEYAYTGGVWFKKSDPTVPVDMMPLDIEYWEIIHDWYEKGYVYPELAMIKDFNAFFNEGKVAVSTDLTFKPGGEEELKKVHGGHDVVMQRMTDVTFTGVNATMNAILKHSKNPERALMFLELVNTDKTLYHLLCYGIKGKHYNEVDGYYQAIEGSGYAPGIDWVFGNQFNGLLREGQPKDLWEQTKQLNESAELSPLYGFTFDQEPVKTENAAISAVNEEYSTILNFGVADPAETAPKYIEALEKAGKPKFDAELKRQLDAWLAANGK